jgi:mannosyltransferase
MLLCAGLLALGVGLRVQGLASHPLWIDEYGSWWAVAGEGVGELWQRVIAVHGQSPLYYVFVRASVEALGPGPLGLRLPSVVFGIALLALCVPLATALFGDRRIALAALAAFAVNERLIFYSQEARPYALALLLAALSCGAWLRLQREPRSGRARAAYLLATAATCYAHYLFGLVVLIHAVHALALRPSLRDLRAGLVTAALLAFPAAPAARALLGSRRTESAARSARAARTSRRALCACRW